MDLLRRRALDAVEEMDRPDCDPGRLERTYAQFGLLNRAVSGWRGIYRRELRPLLSPSAATTLLDIGCGGGDVPLLLSRWAARDGLHLEITAVDPDRRAAAFAARRRPRAGVTFRRQSTRDLLAAGARFDVVVSNHVLHHLAPSEFTAFLAESASLARRRVIHNDLRRSPAAYALFWAAALPFTGSFIRRDGLTSIRRSYTEAELAAAAPPGWTVQRRSPFRNLLVRDAGPQPCPDAATDVTDAAAGRGVGTGSAAGAGR